MARNTSGLIPYKKGQSGNPAGRPPTIKGILKGLPKGAREDVLGILYHAIELNSIAEARAYLKEQDNGQYGIILQVACRALADDEKGWGALNDILDRLFGKVRQTAEITHKGGAKIVVNAPDKETAKRLVKL